MMLNNKSSFINGVFTVFVYSFGKSIKDFMFQILTQYFLQIKKLVVPATGTFVLEQQNAVNDFTTQTVQAPGWNTVFTPVTEGEVANNNENNEGLFDWLADKLKISKEDAILKYDEFCDRLKADLDDGKTVDWNGLGTLQKIDKKIIFTPEPSAAMPFTGVTAKKVIRENASHNVLVGERETTTDEMRAQLSEEKPADNLGRKIMWILFFIALALLGWYFLQNGCNLKNTGNQQKVEVQKSHDTYRLR